MFGRALRRRCPRCGTRAFDSYFAMKGDCPGCGLRFEREHGYWVGAVIVNTTVVFATFLVIVVGASVLTWPDVPWAWVFGIAIVANLVIPILFYPLSKTVWSALELSFHPPEDHELAEAERRLSAD